ncbi:MAG TPA: gliding motility protein GldC [Cryomorphaceae bacterium]|nr:gliding motility protein GldC [Cryomorphaceae bacterium]|tara:strand:+ start:1097 stop:1450 length:354 start_codon:yes stop_codon:yes gene_type:complete
MAIQKESEIKITVGLDENRIPESIVWDAADGGVTNEEAKALMLGVWDEKTSECLRIDLWTKEMLMDDMKHMFHQTFISMADGYERATDDSLLAADMRDFARYFGEKSGIIEPEGKAQ